jgi:hypothetical protein
MSSLTVPEREALDAMTTPQLAATWCALNRFEKPAELAEHFPANWESLTFPAQRRFIGPYMAGILDLIGLKPCLREWNRTRMTDAEFEQWWSTAQGNPLVAFTARPKAAAKRSQGAGTKG